MKFNDTHMPPSNDMVDRHMRLGRLLETETFVVVIRHYKPHSVY